MNLLPHHAQHPQQQEVEMNVLRQSESRHLQHEFERHVLLHCAKYPQQAVQMNIRTTKESLLSHQQVEMNVVPFCDSRLNPTNSWRLRCMARPPTLRITPFTPPSARG
ncbi:hypothetical protein DPMN_121972 [Dreissena polymorpha]|uniref:Uncharacterized protein n=1 Tax=Dreissena polymorpha TaxID=45954 RepID=A0A9D4GR22_DREPO|nr:hypothetical protein DPMN_121972 [Dreissena polymorpha]